MPVDLIHRIGIAAPAETIYRALTTTEKGVRAWQTLVRLARGAKALVRFTPSLP